MKLAMVIDSERCIGCNACTLSCKTANSVPAGYWRNWVKEAVPDKPRPSGPSGSEGGGPSLSHFQPGACMHCRKPSCAAACPSGATSLNESTGEVIIDQALCIGCGNCLDACPYGARYKHPVLHVADKCDYCAVRRAQGMAPACVATCPTRARAFGDLDDPDSDASLRLSGFPNAVKLENSQTPTDPAMIYVKSTAPTDWPRPALTPPAMTALNSVIQPLVKLAVGLTGIGVLGALARQIILPDKPEDGPEDGTEGRPKDGTDGKEAHHD